MRGLVISPKLKVSVAANKIEMNGWDEQNVSAWTLYWDKLVSPDNNLVSIGGGIPVFEILRANKILENKMIKMNSGEGGMATHRSVMQSWADEEEKRPGAWAIATGDSSYTSDALTDNSGRSIQVKLVKSLPVPALETPIDRILSYKRKRSSECEAMWSFIDELYLQIDSARDKPLAEHSVFRKLEVALEDQMKAARENNSISFESATTTLGFNIQGALITGAGVLAAGTTFGTALLTAAGAGVIVNALPRIKIFGTENRKTPLTFAVEVESKLNWK